MAMSAAETHEKSVALQRRSQPPHQPQPKSPPAVVGEPVANTSKTTVFKSLFRRRHQYKPDEQCSLSLDVDRSADAASSMAEQGTLPPSAPAELHVPCELVLSTSSTLVNQTETTPSPASAAVTDVRHYYTVSVSSGSDRVLRDVAMAGRNFNSGLTVTPEGLPTGLRARPSSADKSSSLGRVRSRTGATASPVSHLLVRASRTESIREECIAGTADGEPRTEAVVSDVDEELELRRRRRGELAEKRTGSGGGGLRSYFRWRHKSAPDSDRIVGDVENCATGSHSLEESASSSPTSPGDVNRQSSLPPTGLSSGSVSRSSSGYGGSLTSNSAAKLVRNWFGSFRGGQQRLGSTDRRTPVTSEAAASDSPRSCLRSAGEVRGSSLSKSWNTASLAAAAKEPKSKKKFKVVSVGKESSDQCRQAGTIDVGDAESTSGFGPSDFCEMFRHRANSEPELDALAKAKTPLSRNRKMSESTKVHSDGPNRFRPLQMVIWRDKKRGTQVFQLPRARQERIIIEDIIDDGREELAFARLLNSTHCYDLMPASSKLVVLDTELEVKKAFYALVANNVRSAPLWDASRSDIVGVLSITDFIRILQKCYHTNQEISDDVAENRISSWRETLGETNLPMALVGPNDSLLTTLRCLRRHHVHRLLVVDEETGNALDVLTQKRILRFIYSAFKSMYLPLFINRTLEELRLGTYSGIATASLDSPLIEALNKFVDRGISALPIVDETGKVVDIYAKHDVMGLAEEKRYNNLDITIGAALKIRQQGFEGVRTCKKTETLKQIVERIVEAEVHRLLVVDDSDAVQGIISLSDILHQMVIQPLDDLRANQSTSVSPTPAVAPSDPAPSRSVEQNARRFLSQDLGSVNEAAGSDDVKPVTTIGSKDKMSSVTSCVNAPEADETRRVRHDTNDNDLGCCAPTDSAPSVVHVVCPAESLKGLVRLAAEDSDESSGDDGTDDDDDDDDDDDVTYDDDDSDVPMNDDDESNGWRSRINDVELAACGGLP